jgi:hypothetical protein
MIDTHGDDHAGKERMVRIKKKKDTTPRAAKKSQSIRRLLRKSKKIRDVGRIRTYAPEGTRFLVLRDNHSATTPEVDSMKEGTFE